MTKEILKTGMLVEIEDGRVLKVFKDGYCGSNIIDNSGHGIIGINTINDDLSSNSYSMYNIVKVYMPKSPKSLLSFDTKLFKVVWSKPKKEVLMTIAEIDELQDKKIAIKKNLFIILILFKLFIANSIIYYSLLNVFHEL